MTELNNKMSGNAGKWETVVNKKKSHVTKGDVKRVQQKFIDGDGVPKVEVQDPLKLDKTMYQSAGFKDQNGHISGGEEDEKYPSRVGYEDVKTTQNEVTKSPRVVNKKKEKKVPKVTPVFDPTVKIRKLVASDLQSKITDIKEKFPSHSLIWLKQVAECLQMQLSGPGEKSDLAYVNKNENYPLCEVPNNIQSIVKDLMKECDTNILNTFFIYLNASLVSEVEKGHCTVAERILIQMLCKVNPKVIVNNADEVVAGKSRHGDPYLATMWALSQTVDNLEDGLSVWWSSMFSVLEKKHHATASLNYLQRILRKNDVKKIEKPLITPDQMVQLIEIMTGQKSPLIHTPSLMDEMQGCFSEFVILLLMDGSRKHTEHAFQHILPAIRNQDDPAVLNLIIDLLVVCLSLDKTCMEWWVSNLIHYMRESSVLLKQMRDDPEVWRKLTASKEYRSNPVLIQYIRNILDNLEKANERGRFEKKAGYKDCRKSTLGIIRNQSNRKPQTSTFWKILKLIAVTLLILAAVDVYKSGSYQASRTGYYLKHYGVEEKAKVGFQYMQAASGYCTEHVPYYYRKVSVYTDPALEATWKYLTIAGIWIRDNSKPCRDYLNEVVPPLLEKASYFVAEQYHIISGWVVTSYETYSPIVIETLKDAYVWLYTSIPQAYNYIVNLIILCAQKIYELNPEFFNKVFVIFQDACEYVYTQTPVLLNMISEYLKFYVTSTRNLMEKSHLWLMEQF